jgi:uncharacterized protein YbjT (DUF2867 family)
MEQPQAQTNDQRIGPTPAEVVRRRIVITGGSGFVGHSTVGALRRAWPQAELVVPSRNAQAPASLHASVQWVQCDVHDASTAQRLLQGADALVHLVAVLHGDEARYRQVHQQLAATWAGAARAAGVARVVHVSALGVAADAPSMYLRSKFAGECAWQEASTAAPAQGGGPQVRVLRPSVIFGERDQFTRLFAKLLRWAPVLPLAGAQAQLQPVWVDDVAQAIVALLAQPEAAAFSITEAAGPQVMSLGELVRSVGVVSGQHRLVLGVPEAVGHLQAAVLGLLPGEPLMSADNLRSLRVPNVSSGRHPGLAALGIQASPLAATALHWLGPKLSP